MGFIDANWGKSLSRIFDIRGGRQKFGRLDTSTMVPVVEMGRQITGEGFRSTLISLSCSPLASGTDTDASSEAETPAGLTRIQGITVYTSSTPSWVDSIVLSARVRWSGTSYQIPFWTWGTLNGQYEVLYFDPAGAGVGAWNVYNVADVGGWEHQRVLLNMSSDGTAQPDKITDIVMTVAANAGGAPTVVARIHAISYSRLQNETSGDQSDGIGPPSW